MAEPTSSLSAIQSQFEENAVTDLGAQLMSACWNGTFADVRALVSGGVSVNYQNEHGDSPGHFCINSGLPEILQYLLENGADADMTNKSGDAPLRNAVVFNEPEFVNMLLAHGVALNAINTLGRTALWFASYRGYLPIVELLVKGGADTNSADNYGKTPRAIASDLGHAEVVAYLDPKQLNWHRRYSYAVVLNSIKDEEPLTAMIRVLLCHDTARVIGSFL